MKAIIVKIPVIGYLLRLGSGILFLPRHLLVFRHGLHDHRTKIKALEASSFRANRQIIEMISREDRLEQKIERLRKELRKKS